MFNADSIKAQWNKANPDKHWAYTWSLVTPWTGNLTKDAVIQAATNTAFIVAVIAVNPFDFFTEANEMLMEYMPDVSEYIDTPGSGGDV